MMNYTYRLSAPLDVLVPHHEDPNSATSNTTLLIDLISLLPNPRSRSHFWKLGECDKSKHFDSTKDITEEFSGRGNRTCESDKVSVVLYMLYMKQTIRQHVVVDFLLKKVQMGPTFPGLRCTKGRLEARPLPMKKKTTITPKK